MKKNIKKKMGLRKLRRPMLLRKAWVVMFLYAFVISMIGYYIYHHTAGISEKTQGFIARVIQSKLEHILVEGVKYTGTQDLNNAINMKTGDTLVGINVAEIRKRVEGLKWVKLATVTRELPATLKVEIYEHHPFAKIVVNNKVFVINNKGMIIALSDSRFGGLPTIKGENAAIHAGGLFMLLSEEVKLLGNLSSATYIGERRWDLGFKSGVQVQLPEKNPQQALKILVSLNNERKILEKKHGTIDLRINDRVILRDIE